MALFSEVVAGPAEELLFPYNALRNAALLAARTQLVLTVDADMLLAAGLTATLVDPVGCVTDKVRTCVRRIASAVIRGNLIRGCVPSGQEIGQTVFMSIRIAHTA